MSFDYKKLASTAKRLLGTSSFGVAQTIQRESGGVFDPVTGTTTGSITKKITTYGLEKAVTTEMIRGGSILVGDKLFVLDSTEEPLLTDKFKVGDEFWKIVNIRSVNPVGIAISHEIQVRK